MFIDFDDITKQSGSIFFSESASYQKQMVYIVETRHLKQATKVVRWL